MFLIYDFIIFIYAIVYLPYLLLTRRGFAGFGMRFGLFPLIVQEQIKGKNNIWVHAVSVGEVMVLDGFIDQLKKDYPKSRIIATVTTKTGYSLALERLKGKALVIPSPIDFSFVTSAFIRLIRPKIYIVVETEIWPNLFRNLFLNKIPIVVINGRISDNSFGRYKSIHLILKGILNQVSIWCMQSQRDAQRIVELGADPSRVKVTGNVKFDGLEKNSDFQTENFPKGKDELWWVAGSTHPGEEAIVLDIYAKMIKDNPRWRLVIVPRHVERTSQIIELIHDQGLKVVKYSEIAVYPSGARHDVIIVVDTIGQLRSLYAQADLVFVGKSLCVGGGHNIIEPAFYGKAIIIGPRFENFRDIVACFKEANAIEQVVDAEAFEIKVLELIMDKSRRETLGTLAKKVIDSNQGATRRNLELIAGLIP